GYIAKLGCQIKQTNLVFDDIMLNTVEHYSWDYSFTLSRLVDKDSHLYQTGNPTLWQDLIVRSNLNYYKLLPFNYYCFYL
ncbi:MAG TPA: hypothetical protein PKO13_08875, partial [Nitrosomonas sp.]|nr:hypothetical protein [Nitrosomonas sp.]